LWDPSTDDLYDERWIDDMYGYPWGIDPSTGLEWGVDPSTGVAYVGTTWPNDDGDPLDPFWDDEDVDFGENPETPGYNYGIDPESGEKYVNFIIDDTGEI
jgi:hypothetical protein